MLAECRSKFTSTKVVVNEPCAETSARVAPAMHTFAAAAHTSIHRWLVSQECTPTLAT